MSVINSTGQDQKIEMSYFYTICHWLEKTAALHFPKSKQATLLSRIYQLCQKHGIADIKTLAHHLKNNDIRGLRIELIDTATTNHTFFFREEGTWNYFQSHIIPELQKENNPIRIWSAACSSGEEAYTFSIYLTEHMGLSEAKKNISILASDISQNSLATAEKGVYRASVIKSIPEELKNKYFKKLNNNEWLVNPELKSLCTFRRLNLKAESWPLSKTFQLISCRNVLYYFNQSDQQDIVNKLYQQTSRGGYLLTSVTESLRELKTKWSQISPGIYRKE